MIRDVSKLVRQHEINASISKAEHSRDVSQQNRLSMLEQKEKQLTQHLIEKAKSKEIDEKQDRIATLLKQKEYKDYLDKKKHMKAQLDFEIDQKNRLKSEILSLQNSPRSVQKY